MEQNQRRKCMKTKTNKKSGFTLVELMIVAAIIAILAAIVIPLLASNRDRAVAADGQNLLGTAATAIKAAIAEGKTVTTIDAATVGALTVSELGKSKYFNLPTVTAISVGSGAVTYTLQATTKAGAGTFETGSALTLNDLGAWGGAVATAVNL
jgi:prepilin-type N-terminal cleavage/methylation domain-containing protein